MATGHPLLEVEKAQSKAPTVKGSLESLIKKAQDLNLQGHSYSAEKEKDLIDVLTEVEKNLTKTLKGWASDSNRGATENRLQQVERLRKDIEAGGQKWMRTWVPDSLKAGKVAGIEILKAGGIAEPLLPVIDRQVLANLLVYDYSLIKDWSEGAARIIRTALLQAEIEGIGTRGAAERLLAKGIGDTGVWRGSYQSAKRIARTELIRARNVASDLAYAENGIDRLQWWATLDDRTDGGRSDGDSHRRHKKILTRAQWRTHSFGDKYYGQPPLRPHDRCVMLPVIPGLEKEMEDDDVDEVAAA